MPTLYTSDPERAYTVARIRQCHDLWHMLTGFTIAEGTTKSCCTRLPARPDGHAQLGGADGASGR
ncbi:MAG: hypothetical protein IPI43_13345 [Sandaracinaceae bacterium]|nr:hypothetical protein [Sandaracinaceae bacterium]